MGTSVLKGITTGLLVTILTLLAVLGTTLAGLEKSVSSSIVDFGLLLSCLASGYHASRSSGRIIPAAFASAGYTLVGIILLALYFPVDRVEAVKIISEGTGLGLLSGILGAGVLFSNQRYLKRQGRNYTSGVFYFDEDNPGEDSGPKSVPDRGKAKNREISGSRPEMTEGEEAFAWWNTEARRQLKSR